MRRVLEFIIFIILFFNVNINAGHGAVQNITVTQPWLAVITAFIGGSNVSVSSLSDFSGKNINISNINNKNEKNEIANKIIAIDRSDIKRFNISENTEIWYLYDSFPLKHELNDELKQDIKKNNKNQDENFIDNLSIEAAVLDPSVTPFIAQKIMTALSKWDSDNYPYYQRRLAEFQTRLSSSVLAGKQLLNGTKIYIEDKNLYNLFRAAGCKILQNPDEALIILIDGDVNINNAARRSLRSAQRTKSQNIFEFNRPVVKDNLKNYNYAVDYPAFLHDQYIALWQMVSRTNSVERAIKK